MNFWEKVKKPVFILAPMDGVTDTVFRQIVASVGKPDVYMTEFVPVDALLSKAADRALRTLKYSEEERPIVAQLWGRDPDKFYKSAKIISKLKFDGIDINMGCPDKSAVKKGACSALINNPKLAGEIIKATTCGAGGLPVSVKTRIGFKKIDTENWISFLLKNPISALIIHLRTASEMSKVPAHWEEIEKAVKIRNQLKSKAKILGNGDVKSLKEAREKCQKYQIDGVAIGRSIFDNIWIFNESVDIEKVSPKQKIELLIKHLELFKSTWGDQRNFELMKKFVKCYVNNFNGALDSRVKLMATKNLDQLIEAAKELASQNIV